jgi:hypothetical protein
MRAIVANRDTRSHPISGSGYKLRCRPCERRDP